MDRHRIQRALRAALLTGLDAAALTWCRPDAAELARHVARPRRWIATAGADRVVAELAAAGLWLVALWLGLGLAACWATALPGALGRAAGRLARVTVPRAVHRAVAGAFGLGIVLCPVAASATVSAGRPAPTAAAPPVPAPVWPTDDLLPAPAWPSIATETAPATRPTTARAIPRRAPRRHEDVPHGIPHGIPRGVPHGTGACHDAAVVVRPGDSLWRIAAEHLPGPRSERRVAAAWPRWYAANRTVIGPDPDLLRPGAVLSAPPGCPPGRSAAHTHPAAPDQEGPS